MYEAVVPGGATDPQALSHHLHVRAMAPTYPN